ncbi:MAG: DUF2284 domain-containing protein [Eubacteriaceae bacterium]
MDIITRVQQEKDNLNIHEYAFFDSKEIIFSEEVRKICEKNSCGMYGTSWACPPAIGSIEECKTQCLSYKHAFMFTTVTKVKSSYDIQGWMDALNEHEKVTDRVTEVFNSYYEDLLVLSTEGCSICKKCTYPELPCRFPNRMHPATEGYGIMVMSQAQACEIQYNNGPDTVTYFSMILFD